jgi:hypothetical protein
MNCSKMLALRKQLASAKTEDEALRIQVAIKDHKIFWHPHNCTGTN